MNYSFFDNKTILVLVPHEDDEINICGGLIYTLNKKTNCNIKVCFSTNGDYSYNSKVRQKEAINSLHILGVKESNIYFLGYSDQYSNGTDHIYSTKENDVWISRKNYSTTYDEKYNEYDKNIEHHEFNFNNFKNDIKRIIELIKPDIIFCIDFDSHADHRALSLTFEKVMGVILKNNKHYNPLVYKGFAYPTSYLGKKDYFSENTNSAKFNTEKHSFSKYQNPYYIYEDRIRFPLLEECYTTNIFKNVIFKALLCHSSQLIFSKASSIINNDQIFWQRRTDNLLYNALINVSSGNADYLNDFLCFDCSNVLNGNNEIPNLLDVAWKPDKNDKDKTISIELIKPKKCSELIIYQQCTDSNSYISKIQILINDVIYKTVKLERSLNYTNKIYIDYDNDILKLDIKILEFYGKNFGISELEIFEKKDDIPLILKVVNKDDNFIYNTYKTNIDERLSIYYSTNNGNKQIDDSSYIINNDSSLKIIDINLLECKKLEIKSKNNFFENENLKIKNYDKIENIKYTFYKLYIKFLYVYLKIKRKIKKIFNIL